MIHLFLASSILFIIAIFSVWFGTYILRDETEKSPFLDTFQRYIRVLHSKLMKFMPK